MWKYAFSEVLIFWIVAILLKKQLSHRRHIFRMSSKMWRLSYIYRNPDQFIGFFICFSNWIIQTPGYIWRTWLAKFIWFLIRAIKHKIDFSKKNKLVRSNWNTDTIMFLISHCVRGKLRKDNNKPLSFISFFCECKEIIWDIKRR